MIIILIGVALMVTKTRTKETTSTLATTKIGNATSTSRRIDDYVVIQDAKEKNNIVILRRHHGEQLGIYHCRHCRMEFENEIQLGAHQRLHFLCE